MHEEVDAVPARAMMGVFNKLVMFDQHAQRKSIQSIVCPIWPPTDHGTRIERN